jgi:hypothetical protein
VSLNHHKNWILHCEQSHHKTPGIVTIFNCSFVISFRYYDHAYELTDVIPETYHYIFQQSSHQLSSTIQSLQCRHIFDDFRTIEVNSSLFNYFVCKLGCLWHEWVSLKRE